MTAAVQEVLAAEGVALADVVGFLPGPALVDAHRGAHRQRVVDRARDERHAVEVVEPAVADVRAGGPMVGGLAGGRIGPDWPGAAPTSQVNTLRLGGC